jgi:hypothetical protein
MSLVVCPGSALNDAVITKAPRRKDDGKTIEYWQGPTRLGSSWRIYLKRLGMQPLPLQSVARLRSCRKSPPKRGYRKCRRVDISCAAASSVGTFTTQPPLSTSGCPAFPVRARSELRLGCPASSSGHDPFHNEAAPGNRGMPERGLLRITDTAVNRVG